MNTRHTRQLGTALTVLASTLLFAACDGPNKPGTAGSTPDTVTGTIEQKSTALAADMRQAGKDASQTLSETTKKAGDKVNDAAITAAVNAQLATDPTLSALKVDVDTVNGQVMLRGTAPDAVSREHATSLAARVDGVVAVDNRLVVDAKS